MSIVDDCWRNEYQDDILQVYREKEKELPEYISQSPQLRVRRCLVDWLALIAEKLNLCNTALHLAVYLLDHFMDNHDIDEPRLQLAALGCLSVASKFEDRDSRVPRLSELRKLSCNLYSLQEFLQMEVMLLKYFDWGLYVPTTAHFAECFTDVAASESDLLMGHPITAFSQVQQHIKQYIKYFLDLSLQDIKFLRFRPSLLAAACLASTRICLVISPTWPAALQKKTKYLFDELVPCVEIMMRCHEADQMAARSSTKRKNDEEVLEDSKRLDSGSDVMTCTSSPDSDTCSR